MPIHSKKIDSLLRHEILNVMTTLRFCVESTDSLDRTMKQDFVDAISWVGLLVGQPELFYGQSSCVFLASTSLQELLEVAILLQHPNHADRLQWSPLKQDVEIVTDKNRAKEVLTALLRFVLDQSNKVGLEYKNQVLKIKHDQALLSLPTQAPLDCLKAAKLTHFERLFCSLLHQASALNLSIVSKKGVVEIQFKTL